MDLFNTVTKGVLGPAEFLATFLMGGTYQANQYGQTRASTGNGGGGYTGEHQYSGWGATDTSETHTTTFDTGLTYGGGSSGGVITGGGGQYGQGTYYGHGTQGGSGSYYYEHRPTPPSGDPTGNGGNGGGTSGGTEYGRGNEGRRQSGGASFI